MNEDIEIYYRGYSEGIRDLLELVLSDQLCYDSERIEFHAKCLLDECGACGPRDDDDWPDDVTIRESNGGDNE